MGPSGRFGTLFRELKLEGFSDKPHFCNSSISLVLSFSWNRHKLQYSIYGIMVKFSLGDS